MPYFHNGNQSREYSFWFWYCLSAIICVALLWIPFGFSLGGLIEEWDLLLLLKKQGGFWNSFPGSPMSESFAARPLQILPFYIPQLISPNSFLGFHILEILSCFLRIVAAAIIGRYIFNNLFYGLIFGLLAFLMPADTQQLVFRTINISCSLALMLSAAAMLILAIEGKSAVQKWLATLTSMLLAITATFIYEPILTLYSIPILAIFAREGMKGTIAQFKQMPAQILVWLIAPLINLCYLLYTLTIYKSGYQLAANKEGFLSSIAHNYQYLLDTATYRIFYQGWLELAQIIFPKIQHWSFLLFSLSVFLFILWRCNKNPRRLESVASFGRIIVVGFILFTVAYFPYMVSLPHLSTTQRTLMAPSFGAAMIIVAILAAIVGKKRIVTTFVATILVFLGFVAQLYQMDTYTSQYVNVIRPYMSMVADRANPDKKIHLVIDKSGLGGYVNGMFFTKVETGPAVRLNKPDELFILCKETEPSQFMKYSQCVLKDQLWTLSEANGTSRQFTATEVDAIVIGDDFETDYHSKNPNWHDLGSFNNQQSIFSKQTAGSDWYSCSPDSDWGYSGFCRGDGWADGRSLRDEMAQTNYIIAIAPTASLKFLLKPSAKDYKLQIHLFEPINNFVVPQLKIFINGIETNFSLKADTYLEATIKAKLLKPNLNNIEFHNIMPAAASGLAFNRLVVAPIDSPYLAKTVSNPAIKLLPEKWMRSTNADILLSGFSLGSQEGTWTDGKFATMHIALPEQLTEGTLVIESAAYLNDKHKKLDVSAEIKGQVIASKRFSNPAPQQFAIPISKKNMNEDGSVFVTLEMNEPASPPVGDNRKLGLFLSRFKLIPRQPSLIPDEWVKPVDKKADQILASGFSIRGEEGVWTDGKSATMQLALPEQLSEGTLIIEGAPYLNDQHQKLKVHAEINEKIVASQTFSDPSPQQFAIPIGKHNINNGGSVWITLKMDKPVSPPVGDDRKLGIFIFRFKFIAETS